MSRLLACASFSSIYAHSDFHCVCEGLIVVGGQTFEFVCLFVVYKTLKIIIYFVLFKMNTKEKPHRISLNSQISDLIFRSQKASETLSMLMNDKNMYSSSPQRGDTLSSSSSNEIFKTIEEEIDLENVHNFQTRRTAYKEQKLIELGKAGGAAEEDEEDEDEEGEGGEFQTAREGEELLTEEKKPPKKKLNRFFAVDANPDDDDLPMCSQKQHLYPQLLPQQHLPQQHLAHPHPPSTGSSSPPRSVPPPPPHLLNTSIEGSLPQHYYSNSPSIAQRVFSRTSSSVRGTTQPVLPKTKQTEQSTQKDTAENLVNKREKIMLQLMSNFDDIENENSFDFCQYRN